MTQTTTTAAIAASMSTCSHSLCVSLGLLALVALACGNSPASEAGPQDPSQQPDLAPQPAEGSPEAAHKVSNDDDRTARTVVSKAHTGVSAPTKPAEMPPQNWPAELPWVPGSAPDSTFAEASEAGDHLLYKKLGRAPLESLIDPWRQALAATGFKEQTSCAADPEAMTFECLYRNEQRLALLIISPRGGDPKVDPLWLSLHALPPGHRPLQALPGPCVIPPTRERRVQLQLSGVDQKGRFHQSVQERRVRTMPGFDLDGDGTSDVLVPAKPTTSARTRDLCPWQIPMDVYVMRGECGHKIGTIIGNLDETTMTAPFVAGIRELSATATWADDSPAATGTDDPRSKRTKAVNKPRGGIVPSHHQRTRLYRFSGQKLLMKSDHDEVGRCHHCSVTNCVAL